MSIKRVRLAAAALLLATIPLTPTAASAAPTGFEFFSGDGAIGTVDPLVEMSVDGGATFGPAAIIPAHPNYNVIEGTRYVSDANRGLSRPFSTTVFRASFMVSEVDRASLDVCVHADNAADVLVNGSSIGRQQHSPILENFQNPVECYSTESALLVGLNRIDFVVTNLGAFMGLDFKAVLTYANDPPELTVPGDITVDATGPGGAIVTFIATAVDDSGDPPTVDCIPSSSSTFSVGTTTVVCTATDAQGATDVGSFDIRVLGAADQLNDLLAKVNGVGPGKSLSAKVKSASSSLAAGNVGAACASLQALINELSAQSGKQIPEATASSLTTDAQRIRSVIGCS